MLSVTSNLTAPVPQQVRTMMCGLVHDLRQPLSVIDACADYLNLVLPATNEPAHRQLELLQDQVAEANRMLHDALLELDNVAAHAGQNAPR